MPKAHPNANNNKEKKYRLPTYPDGVVLEQAARHFLGLGLDEVLVVPVEEGGGMMRGKGGRGGGRTDRAAS